MDFSDYLNEFRLEYEFLKDGTPLGTRLSDRLILANNDGVLDLQGFAYLPINIMSKLKIHGIIVTENMNFENETFEKIQGISSITMMGDIFDKIIDFNYDFSSVEDLKILDYEKTEVPDEIIRFKNLKSLHIENKSLYYGQGGIEKVSNNIVQLHNLEKIKITLKGNADLSNIKKPLKRLRTLDLTGSVISHIPEAFFELKSLETIIFPNHELNEIPDKIGNLVNLKVIDLRIDQTIGNMFKNNMDVQPIQYLPSSIGNLRNLEEMYLNLQSIRELPIELFNCTKLKILDLSDNPLIKIPKEIGNLKNLVSFDISRSEGMEGYIDELIESIPIEMKKLRRLKNFKYGKLSNYKNIGEVVHTLMRLPRFRRRKKRLRIFLEHVNFYKRLDWGGKYESVKEIIDLKTKTLTLERLPKLPWESMNFIPWRKVVLIGTDSITFSIPKGNRMYWKNLHLINYKDIDFTNFHLLTRIRSLVIKGEGELDLHQFSGHKRIRYLEIQGYKIKNELNRENFPRLRTFNVS